MKTPRRAPSNTKNPKILHRVYFEDMPPYGDPFRHYLDTWHKEMPDYTVMKWNAGNINLEANEWVRRAHKARAPVFISEYARWNALSQYGGMYLDADCEVLNGPRLHDLIEELYASNEYDAFIGVEEAANGHPTAQTVAAKKGSELVAFMMDMYERQLSGPLWHWREERGLIGPQLLSLYFRDLGFNLNKGFFCNLDAPMVFGRVKVYTQDYFSPKFTSTGRRLNVTSNTVIYHLFSNLNIAEVDPESERHRKHPLLFNEYCKYLEGLDAQKVSAQRELEALRAKQDDIASTSTQMAVAVDLLRENNRLLNAVLGADGDHTPVEQQVAFHRVVSGNRVALPPIPLRGADGRISIMRLLWLLVRRPRYMAVRIRNGLTGKPWYHHKA